MGDPRRLRHLREVAFASAISPASTSRSARSTSAD